jgi:protein-histidine pros-kinase
MFLKISPWIGLGGTAVAAAAIGLALHHNTLEIDDANHWVTHTQTVIQALDKERALTSQSLYLIHGNIRSYDPNGLRQARSIAKQIREQAINLRKLTHDNAAQQYRLDQIDGLVRQIDLELQGAVRNSSLNGPEISLNQQDDVLSSLLYQLRRQLLEMTALEEELLTMRRDRESRVWRQTLVITEIGGGLIALWLLAVTWIAVRAGKRLENTGVVLLRTQADLARVHEQKRIEESSRRLLEAAPDAMIVAGKDGRIAIANTRANELFGYQPDELIGASLHILIPARFQHQHGEKFAAFFFEPRGREMGSTTRIFGRRKDGSEFPAEIVISPLQTEDGMLVIGGIRDITERHEAEERILAANRHKSEFLANMSHEFRTPLNAIIGFTSFLHSGKAGPLSAEQTEYLGDILSSSRQLLSLVNDVLDLAKIEAGRLEFRNEKVNLRSLMEEVCDALRALAAEKCLQIDTTIEGETAAVLDPIKFKQVLYNFLSNAIKFTAEGGQIKVRIQPEGANIRLEVEDNGIGIKPEDVGRLFIDFEQLDGSSTKHYQGTGLGLALTKRLVEAQGGEVWATSTFGVGSIFAAVLPRQVSVSTVNAEVCRVC